MLGISTIKPHLTCIRAGENAAGTDRPRNSWSCEKVLRQNLPTALCFTDSATPGQRLSHPDLLVEIEAITATKVG
jgi:hypothetical protein